MRTASGSLQDRKPDVTYVTPTEVGLTKIPKEFYGRSPSGNLSPDKYLWHVSGTRLPETLVLAHLTSYNDNRIGMSPSGKVKIARRQSARPEAE